VRALLAYLVIEAARPHRREALAALLWPDYAESAARAAAQRALQPASTIATRGAATSPGEYPPDDTVQPLWRPHRGRDCIMALMEACEKHKHASLEECTAASSAGAGRGAVPGELSGGVLPGG